MDFFQIRNLLPYLQSKGWTLTYSQDDRHYWNCSWENSTTLYVIEVPVWPGSKILFYKHKLRGYAVERSTGDILNMPDFQIDMKLDRYMTYHYLRLWITALMEQQ
jgi:hypothetical protein